VLQTSIMTENNYIIIISPAQSVTSSLVALKVVLEVRSSLNHHLGNKVVVVVVCIDISKQLTRRLMTHCKSSLTVFVMVE